MAAFVQNFARNFATNGAGVTTLTLTTSGVATTAGNTLLIGISTDNVSTFTIADNSSQAGAANSYSQEITSTNFTGGGDPVALFVYRCALTRAILATDTITITFTGTKPTLVAATCQEFSGINTSSPMDVTATNRGNGTGLSSGTTGTTASSGDLAIAYFALGKNGTPMPVYSDATSGYSTVTGTGTSTAFANNRQINGSYKVTSGAGTQTDAPALSVASLWAGAILTYLPSSTSVSASAPSGSGTASGGANAPAIATDSGAAGLATADSGGVPSWTGASGTLPGSATANAAGANWSEATSGGSAGLATAGAASPSFTSTATLNIAAAPGSATADSPGALSVTAAASASPGSATAGAAVPGSTIVAGTQPSPGSATASGGVAAPLISTLIPSAGLAFANAGIATGVPLSPNENCLFPDTDLTPTSVLTPDCGGVVPGDSSPGGGGFGALMSDAHFQRYTPRYQPTIRRQKAKV